MVNRNYFYIGLILTLAFLAQYFFELPCAWLVDLQRGGDYKIYSGIALAAYVLIQWSLSLFRAAGKMTEARFMYRVHNLIGVLAPVFFYAHSVTFGYGYQILLAASFFAVVVVGVCNLQFLGIRGRGASNIWMILHIVPSALVVILMAYHIYVVAYYQ
ncbi:MAG: hypothetical protein ACT4NX_01315 [Deltaproteobacteria bacterium]